jgi:hypothetical protein
MIDRGVIWPLDRKSVDQHWHRHDVVDKKRPKTMEIGTFFVAGVTVMPTPIDGTRSRSRVWELSCRTEVHEHVNISSFWKNKTQRQGHKLWILANVFGEWFLGESVERMLMTMAVHHDDFFHKTKHQTMSSLWLHSKFFSDSIRCNGTCKKSKSGLFVSSQRESTVNLVMFRVS